MCCHSIGCGYSLYQFESSADIDSRKDARRWWAILASHRDGQLACRAEYILRDACDGMLQEKLRYPFYGQNSHHVHEPSLVRIKRKPRLVLASLRGIVVHYMQWHRKEVGRIWLNVCHLSDHLFNRVEQR